MPKESNSSTASTFSAPTKDGLLDEINCRLLAELSSDPRIAMSALARRVKMSAPAVTERVQRLERAGVITGYRLEIDPAALGLPSHRVRSYPSNCRAIVQDRRAGPITATGHRMPSHHR